MTHCTHLICALSSAQYSSKFAVGRYLKSERTKRFKLPST
ncbi:Uncharacterised protein [Vibrio cholerae]|nr:Uncharacterised protein [Vibrio cholerae]